MDQLAGFVAPKFEGLVCKLYKALYGLKQAPCAQFEKLTIALISFGFISTKSDKSLFIRFTSSYVTYLLVYPDDIILTRSDSKELSILITKLNAEFALKDLGELTFFLGIQVLHTN